jgi:hypothetical protein
VEPIDAGGLYCCLTRYERYVEHPFAPYTGAAFGPDVARGFGCAMQGYSNTSIGTWPWSTGRRAGQACIRERRSR